MKHSCAIAMQLAKALSELVRVQLFTEQGDLDSQVEALIAQQRKRLQGGLA